MELVVEHHEDLEHDLLPDVDLLDLWRGRLSFRRLELLIRRLPTDSATVHAVHPESALIAAWSPTDYVLADLYDITARAHFKDPKPYPRPADAIRERQRRDARREALQRQKERVARQRALAESGKEATRA